MTKEEFLKRWREMVDQDCKRMGTDPPSVRKLYDHEITELGKHLFAWFEIYIQTELPSVGLAEAMCKTSGKFQSFQDWAGAIVDLLKKQKSP